jgi:hypothetical protein
MSHFEREADIAPTGRFDLALVMTSKRIRRRAGDILKISLGGGVHSYAQVAEEPLIVFFDGAWNEELPPGRVIGLTALFRIWVHNDAVKNGTWPVIGNQPLAPEHAAEPYFYKQDAITGRLSLYHSSFADTGWERPASAADCDGLECAAVWDAEHVEDRLRDHYAEQPNLWFESLRIDKRAMS